MKHWTKLLPFAFVRAYRDTFFTTPPRKPEPIDPATLRPDADLADLGRPMKFQLLPNAPAEPRGE